MNDRLFEESNEERIARLRRRFETGVERGESAHKKAVETVADKAEAVDAAKQALEDFDRAFAEKDRELKHVDCARCHTLSVVVDGKLVAKAGAW